MLIVDKNLYHSEQHLRNILKGSQTENLENLTNPNRNDNYSFEVLKRRECVKNNHLKNKEANKCLNSRVDMIGSGKLFKSGKIESMIKRDKYFNEKRKDCNRNESTVAGLLNDQANKFDNIAEQKDLYSGKYDNYMNNIQQRTNERSSQMSDHNRPGYRSPTLSTEYSGRKSLINQSQYDNYSQKRQSDLTNEYQENGIHAKDHNDQLFRRKSGERKSMDYTITAPSKICLFSKILVVWINYY